MSLLGRISGWRARNIHGFRPPFLNLTAPNQVKLPYSQHSAIRSPRFPEVEMPGWYYGQAVCPWWSLPQALLVRLIIPGGQDPYSDLLYDIKKRYCSDSSVMRYMCVDVSNVWRVDKAGCTVHEKRVTRNWALKLSRQRHFVTNPN